MKLLKRVIAISGAAALIAGGAAFSACANGEDDAKTFDNVITATADAGYKSADISGGFTATMTMTANGADVSQDITAAISGVRSLSSLSSDIKVVAEGTGISSSAQQGEGVAYAYAYMRDGAIFTASAEEEIKDSDIASTQFTVADMFADLGIAGGMLASTDGLEADIKLVEFLNELGLVTTGDTAITVDCVQLVKYFVEGVEGIFEDLTDTTTVEDVYSDEFVSDIINAAETFVSAQELYEMLTLMSGGAGGGDVAKPTVPSEDAPVATAAEVQEELVPVPAEGATLYEYIGSLLEVEVTEGTAMADLPVVTLLSMMVGSSEPVSAEELKAAVESVLGIIEFKEGGMTVSVPSESPVVITISELEVALTVKDGVITGETASLDMSVSASTTVESVAVPMVIAVQANLSTVFTTKEATLKDVSAGLIADGSTIGEYLAGRIA